MPRSPHRRSSSYDRGKRDYRHVEKGSQDRYYGAQSRKKVNRGNQYSERPRDDDKDRRREPYDDRNKNRQPYEQRPVIRIEPKQAIEVKRNQPRSQIKVHFRFKPLKVKLNQEHEQDLKKKLKSFIADKNGPIEYFERSADSYPGYLILELGFKYDSDALMYQKEKNDITITVEKQEVNIAAEPTNIFKFLIDAEKEKKKKTSKHEDRGKSRSPSHRGKKDKSSKHKRKRSYSESDSRSSRKSSRSRKSKKSNRDKERGRKEDRRQQRREERKQDYKYERKDQFNEYRRSEVKKDSGRGENSQRQNFYRQQPVRQERRQSFGKDRPRQEFKQSIQERIKEPEQQFNKAQGQAQQKQLNYTNGNGNKSALASGAKSQTQLKQQKTLFFFGIHYSVNSKHMDDLFRNLEGGPYIHQQLIWRQMKDSIAVFLEGSVQPYHLLKGMKECGRVVQIISNNKLNQQGRSEYYNVTFNSRQVCQKLKSLQKTSKEIFIEEVTVQNAVIIYRPNNKTELMTVNLVQDNKSQRSSHSRDRHYKDRSYNDKYHDRSYDRHRQR